MLPEIKVYKINYEFIISNYLDINLWNKEWTLFVYKEHTFQLRMYEIDTLNKRIRFQIRKNGFYNSETISYDMKNTSIDILKQQINGAIFRVMQYYEDNLITNSHEYNMILETRDSERERLRDIAEEFLDSEGVTNTDIRDAYIDSFVDKNETVWETLSNYRNGMKYNILTDMFVIFCKITNDNDRLKNVLNNVTNVSKVERLLHEMEEFNDTLDSEEYYQNMTSELEAI